MAGAAVGSFGVLLPRTDLRRCTRRCSRSFVRSSIGTQKEKLACPICYFPLTNNLDCGKCKKTYVNNGTYFDLTISELLWYLIYTREAGDKISFGADFPDPKKRFTYSQLRGLFAISIKLGSFLQILYDRSFQFEMANEYLKPVFGGTILDASCGSGLFSRLFVKCDFYSQVIALDFSENMLKQCFDFVQSQNIPTQKLVLVRGDISRLPLCASSIDAVHAGAALHCWPSPASAVAEISRVLRPGGVFVATTFIVDVVMPVVPVLRFARQYYAQVTSNTIYVSKKELEELCSACGLVKFTCVRNGLFVMISARKPS